MTHESNYAIGNRILVDVVKNPCCGYYILLGCQQRHTQLDCNLAQILVIQVTQAVVGKVLDVVNYA